MHRFSLTLPLSLLKKFALVQSIFSVHKLCCSMFDVMKSDCGRQKENMCFSIADHEHSY